MGKLLNKATDSAQYDKGDPKWEEYGLGLQSPTRAHFWEYLKPYSSEWEGKDILEIGSGTGWLLDLALKAGANSVIGVEPSKNSVKLGKKYYPLVNLVRNTFEKFTTNNKYDEIIALLSFVHIKDIKATFKKINSFLKKEGELIAVVPDFDYFSKPRFGYKILIEELNKEEYVAMIERPESSIADIARTVNLYRRIGLQFGLILIEDKPLPPSELLMRNIPRYREMDGIAMSRLLRVRKLNK